MFPEIDVKPVPDGHIVESGAKWRGTIFYEANSPPFIITPRLSETRCFFEAYTGLPVVRATENQKALNCVVLKYSIPVSEE